MALIVQKFGGSSVGDAEKLMNVARIVANTAEQGNKMVVVVSAMGKTTDGLVQLAQKIAEHPHGREYDALLATGEMVSTALLAMALETLGYPAVGLNGFQAGVKTEDLHNRARVLSVETEKIFEHLNNGKIVVVTGFQGVNSRQEFTTLGRGGSDTSAVALAGALNADCCDIFTDVKGVYSTDPRIVPHAVKLNDIAYIEMLELARLGAKVLHPRAVETARQFGARVCVRSTFDLEDSGTMVVGEEALESSRRVTGIACDKNQVRVAMLAVPDRPGIAAAIFGGLAKENISVDMIIQSLVAENPLKNAADERFNNIAFTINNTDLPEAQRVMESVRATIGGEAVVADADIAKVSIVGVGMIDKPGIASDMFNALAAAGINIKMITTSEIKISCLVEKEQADQAIRVIHTTFFPEAEALKDVMVDEKLGY